VMGIDKGAVFVLLCCVIIKVVRAAETTTEKYHRTRRGIISMSRESINVWFHMCFYSCYRLIVVTVKLVLIPSE